MAPYVKTLELPRDREASDAGLVSTPPLHRPNILSRVISGVSRVDETDATERYNLEEADNKEIASPGSSSSSVTSPERKVISWDHEDPENPYNFSSAKKATIVFIGMVVVVNSTMGSSLPSNAIPIISEYFHLASSYTEVLPISMYLVGYVLGPLLFGPLSESFGRRIIMTSTFFTFTVWTLACALAPNFPAFLIFRVLTGISASSPITVIGGVYADIYNDPVTRGRAMAVFMGGTCVGPLLAPLISGFVAPALGWRWVFWIGLIVAGASWIPMIFLPETYGPTLLAKRAARLRKTTGNQNIFAPIELEKKGVKQMVTVTLTRPLRMLFFELIVSATCIYLSLAYGIFYIFFSAFPIVFQGIYGQSLGVSGLMFLPIGVGAFASIAVFLWYDAFLRKAQALHKPWTLKEESRRLPLACIGGPMIVLALFWLGWTSRTSIPFVVPMLAGIPFGIGFILIFMALLNYLTDAYEIFAASAMAAASCTRSLAGAVLPFAAAPMYDKLGVAWASSLLGFLSMGMCVIPFLFLWKGDRIREGSKFCRYLKEKKAKELAELERDRQRRLRLNELNHGGNDVVSEKV
ncbi:MFS general substrate transporter [Mollisia scopiformis]|uniref:MFS general substrate transporter n=1 Tax=Mollisia scopiformis TaxID=149040 RepID=A0A194XMZ7_MOLSC|nr:MFS general substrate transporter [Mollisia scopiformis]KUJ21533.1 MFS general substrate transporter [Mollisia scopiformis]